MQPKMLACVMLAAVWVTVFNPVAARTVFDPHHLTDQVAHFGHFLHYLSEQCDSVKAGQSDKANSLLQQIDAKQKEMFELQDQIEQLLSEQDAYKFTSDQLFELQTSLYNCRSFQMLSTDFVEQLRKLKA